MRLVLFLLAFLTAAIAAGQEPPATVASPSVDKAELDATPIRQAIAGYLAAHEAKDVTKLLAYWTPEGVYLNRTSGERIAGHEALATALKTHFEGSPNAKLALATEVIEFISPNVALERGQAVVTDGDELLESQYNAVYVKRDGKWLIDRVTETDLEADPSHYAELNGLEWLIGEWVDEFDGNRVETACRWTRNQNFISRTYKVVTNEGVQSSGLQIIGWDPVAKQIRSWLFDSSGGFIAGTWHDRGEKWVVSSLATFPDGVKGSFTSIFRPLEDGTYGWQKINRVVDGQLMPNLDESIVRPQSMASTNATGE